MTLLYTMLTVGLSFTAHWGIYRLRRQKKTPSVSGRAIMYAFFALLGLTFSLFGWSIFTTPQIDTSQWPTTDGIVTTFEVEEVIRDRGFTFSGDVTDPLYLVQLTYSYSVDDQAYTSSQRYLNEALVGGRLQLEADELKKAEARFQVGNKVTVYYNPDNPTEAALENASRTPYRVLGLGSGLLGGVIAGVFAFPFTQFAIRQKDPTEDE